MTKLPVSTMITKRRLPVQFKQFMPGFFLIFHGQRWLSKKKIKYFHQTSVWKATVKPKKAHSFPVWAQQIQNKCQQIENTFKTLQIKRCRNILYCTHLYQLEWYGGILGMLWSSEIPAVINCLQLQSEVLQRSAGEKKGLKSVSQWKSSS